jgi:hypothetical protein
MEGMRASLRAPSRCRMEGMRASRCLASGRDGAKGSREQGRTMAPYVRLFAVAGSSLIVMAGAYKQWSTGGLFSSPARTGPQ